MNNIMALFNLLISVTLQRRLQSEGLKFYSVRYVPEGSLTGPTGNPSINNKTQRECEEKTEGREDRGQDQNEGNQCFWREKKKND